MVTGTSHHGASSLSDYVRIVRRRIWIVIVCAILVPTVAYALSARQPAVYQASAEVYLSTEDLAAALTGITASYVDESRMTATQAKLAHVPGVAERTIKLSGIKGITSAELLGSVDIVPDSTTNILTFVVRNHDRVSAERLATAYARAFKTYRGELDSQAVRSARKDYATRLDALTAEGKGSSPLAVSIRSKEEQLAVLEALQTGRTYVVRTADGAAKIAPTPRRNASLGLMLGIVLGLGLAFLVELFDTRVRSADEVGKRLGLTQLARLTAPPKRLAKEDKLAMIVQPASPEAESFRMLRTNLEFATLGSHSTRTILVTSAIEQEGKSTTAANLAVAEARAGLRVALVDLDLRVPYIDRFFGLLHAEGITDVALGRVSLELALTRIDLETGTAATPTRGSHETNGHGPERGCLDVLVSGPRPPDPGEFVGTQQLADILTSLRSRYDRVIVDTPPALRVGDAMTLSTRADGILVVTRLSVIRRPLLSELKRMLDKTPARKLGYVVTGSRERPGDYGYGYGYGGYGYALPAPELPPDASRPANGAAAPAAPLVSAGPEESVRT